MKPEYKPFVDELIELCIKEDIGDGDHTSLSCIPAGEHGRMRLLCKQEGIIAGIEIARIVFDRLDPDMHFEQVLHDGDRVKPGDVAFYVSGRLRSLLQAERIILNIMQRMSGVATQTAVYVARLEGLHTKVLDTRKTTPGMRVLEVGTGSGYQAAVLAAMGCTVYTVERLKELYQSARALLQQLDLRAIHMQRSDGTLGMPAAAPFDRIIVTAGGPQIPRPLLEQLAVDGILLIPVGARPRTQRLMRIMRRQGRLCSEDLGPAVFVDLVGDHGW